nr:putative peroxidase 61 [Quercus suber]
MPADGFGDNITQTLHLFALRGFDGRAEVNLIGACNIGKIGREFILKRLSNFKETGQPKPTVASDLLTEMRISQSLKERGLLLADQQFLANENIARLVRAYASNDGSTFQMDFSWTMMKMSELNVLTGFPASADCIAADENEVEQAKSSDKSVAYNMNEVLQRVCRLEYHGF